MSAQAAVLAELRRRVFSGELRSGQRILAETVATELGVSRVPVREALKVLEGEGLIVSTPHRGYSVKRLDPADLWEIFRMRELLETEAILLAARSLDDARIAQLDEAMAELERADLRDSNLEFAEAARRFQFIMFELEESCWLGRFIRMLWDSFDHYRPLFYVDASRRRLVLRDYRNMVDALRRRDIHEAVALLDDHRRRSIRTLAAHVAAATRSSE